MGQEIVYCFKCQTRLLGADFEKGRAFKIGPRSACAECAKELLGPAQIQQEANRAKGAAQDKSGRHLAPPPDLAPSESTSKVRPFPGRTAAPSRRSPAPVIALAVAGIFGLLILVALAFSSRRPSRGTSAPESRVAPPAPDPTPAPAPAPVDPPRPDPPRPVPIPPKPVTAAELAKELPEVDRDVLALIRRQEFTQATGFLTSVQSRHAAPEWVRAIEERIGQLREETRRAASQAAVQAVAARRKGDEAEVARLRAKVVDWRSPVALDEFDKTVSPARPSAPVPGGALVVYADALAPGWSNFSWDVKVDLASESTVFEGARAISVATEKLAGGLYLGVHDRFDTSPYSDVAFMLYSRAPGIPLTLSVYSEKEALADPFPLDKVEGGLPAGQWRKYVVPLSRLGAVRAKVRGVVIQSFHVSAETVFFVDQVHFLKGPSEESAAPARELEAYRVRWVEAAARAARRDYAAAEREIDEAMGALKEGPVRDEAAADLADLRSAGAALAEALRILSRIPRTQKIGVEFVGASGAGDRLEGFVVAADAARLSIHTEAGVIDVPTGELTGAGLADLFRRRPGAKPGDERAGALLCLFDGDAEGARKQKAAALPEKAAALARPEGEAPARSLFWTAEAEFASPRHRAAAVEKYLALVGEHGANSFVVRNRPFLAARLEAAREAFWAADDLSVGGTFQVWSPPKQDPVWLNLASAKGNAKENFVELEFYARADGTYRAWVYAGGCCYETLSCSVQASELKGPSAKNPKETVSLEPGAEEGMPVRAPSVPLKRLHASHGGARQPARWEWLPLTLPKFSTPGRKKVRVLTEEIGFGVAGAFVSASRSSPPRESEWSEWLKGRPPLEPFATGFLVWEVWHGIPGDAVAELTGNPAFERKPSATGGTDRFEVGDLGDNYGCRVRGYVLPPATGPYTFWIASDDQSELWLSSDDAPLKKVKILDFRGVAGSNEWTRDPSQKSAPVALVGGKRYYIEALQKEGLVAAHLQVGWQLPDGSLERPVPGKRLSPFGAMPTRKTPKRLYRAVNLGGPPLVIDGHAWEGRDAPNLAPPAGAFENPAVKLDPPTDANRAQMIRASVWARPSTSVKMTAVPPGAYEVYLYIWEDSEPQGMDFLVQGQTVLEKYNTGAPGHWDRLGPWKVTVTDGTLEVASRGGDANFSGLEVWRLGR